ncbi:MAG: erythronate-4-phosphate dehydrogenase [Proteobacteria bacterium]|nr:erythronate-4-phosphate dehydrogenase [Pseudomonadota bacterium]
MKIAVDKGIKSFEKIITSINGFNKIEFEYLETQEITNDKLKDTEALFIRSTTLVDKALLKNTKIKIVGSATAGIDHLDIKYLNNKNIKWFCAEGCNSLSVVNYVMSVICYLKSENLFNINDSVGIVGYGNIGKKLKFVLDTFSITNSVYDPFLDHDFLSNINTIKECDLISLHVPLTHKTLFPTFKLVDQVFIDDISNKTLINTSRGGIVDEQSLLKNSKVNYISDVWINEPTPSKEIIDYSLLSTPHIAGHSFNGKLNGTLYLIKRLQEFLDMDKSMVFENNKKMNCLSEAIKLTEPYNIDTFYSEYPIKQESSKFKKAYLGEQEDFKAIFESSRSNHYFRKDIEI